jgi:hypothetical protein
MSPRFGASLATHAKTHNASGALHAKVAMRRNVLDTIGASSARVFDAYAGPGEMWSAVWREASHYTGCDEEWFKDERRVFVADNQLVMRTLDLGAFNVFDLDAFGSPWECATILAARRKVKPDELVGLCLTDGSGLRLKMSGVPHALARLAGVGGSMKLANRGHEALFDRALSVVCERMGAEVVKRWRAVSTVRAGMRYEAMVLRGLTE